MMDYESGIFMKGIVQIFHRATAYLLAIMIAIFFLKVRKMNVSPRLALGNNLMFGMLIFQFILGVLTIINCIGKVPLFYGAIHQAGALILLVFALFVHYQFRTQKAI
jgi:cytochrome c oxidase assembly protein subunit 15